MTADQIRFCMAPDGVRIAYATCGEGLPLLRAATWLTHLEFDRQVHAHWLADLGRDFTYVRYDMRGCGLSDPDVATLSLTAGVGDLAVVADAAGLDRFALLGVSGGGPVAIAYAVAHPERVSHLVLYGSYARGRALRSPSAAQLAEGDLLVALTRVGWGRSNPAFRRVFTTLYMPDASPSEVAAFEEVQRLSCSAETAARIRQASYHVDVTDLAKRVAVPTLVLHARDDASVPFEEGRRLAALIPGAAFVPLEGRNHVLMSSEPAWNQFVTEVKRFVAEPVRTPQPRLPSLSRREQEVLRLVAEGMDNDAIAQRLSLSTRTVERHLSHAYAKLGVSGKAARAAAAVRFARAL